MKHSLIFSPDFFASFLSRICFAPEGSQAPGGDGGDSGESSQATPAADAANAADEGAGSSGDASSAATNDTPIGGQAATEESAGDDTAAASAAEPLTVETFQALLPEGLEAEVDEDFVEVINGAETREDLIKAMLTRYQSEVANLQTAQVEAWNSTMEEWRGELRECPTYGGSKLDASLATANKLVQTYGGAEFAKLLTTTGTGNHVEMLRFLNKISVDLPQIEGAPVANVSGASEPKSLANRMFPDHK